MKAFEWFYVEKLNGKGKILESGFKNKKDMREYVDGFWKSICDQGYYRAYRNSLGGGRVCLSGLIEEFKVHFDFVNIYHGPKRVRDKGKLPEFYMRIHPIMPRHIEINNTFITSNNEDEEDFSDRDDDDDIEEEQRSDEDEIDEFDFTTRED